MFRAWLQPWVNDLSSSLSSLLGKREKEETDDSDQNVKRRKQDKATIEKDVINGALMDFISAFVDQDKTRRRVEDLTYAEIKKLLNKHPDINGWFDSNAKELNTKVPQLWKTHLENCKVKKAFLVAINALGVRLGDGKVPIFEKGQPNLSYIEKLLQNFDLMKINFTELEQGIGKVIEISNHEEYLWKAAISPFKRQTFGKASEQELSRSLFLPLFNFISNLLRCSGNANCSIRDLTSFGSISDGFRSKIPDFHPDDFVVVEYKDAPCIRLIREDSIGLYNNHTHHKDFIALICQMRLALGKTVRNMIRDKLDEWHDMITVLGISTDSSFSYVYSMHCIVDSRQNKYSISYILNYIGSFSHFEKLQRIELIAKIIATLSTPNIGVVDKYLHTNTGNIPIDSTKKQNDMPKSFRITSQDHSGTIDLSYCDNLPSYYRNGKHLKTAQIVNSSIYVFVKYNSNTMFSESKTAEYLPLLSLYLPTIDSYCISFAGTTLSDFIRDKKTTNLDSFFVDLITQLSLLEYYKIIHNDIKPDNIVLFKDHWFLIDYEISARDAVIATSPYFSRGYRSPERREKLIISPKSDIYSLGLVLLDMCKGTSSEWESCDEESIFKDVEKYMEDKIQTYVKLMLKSNSDERLSSLQLYEVLKKDGFESILRERYTYYSKKDRFWSLIPSNTVVARRLNFESDILGGNKQ